MFDARSIKAAINLKVLLLPLALISTGFLTGCADETKTTSNQNVSNNTFKYTGTLQGSVFDATSGARIGDSSLSITLVDGASYIKPSMIKNNPTSDDPNFSGDYAFNKVSVTLNGTKTYRVVATATGYQTFEAYVTWNTGSGANNTLDTVYSMIGNIYLFPLGATAPDLSVNVTASNDPVSGAIVQLQPQINNNASTSATSNSLSATGGTMANLSATTDADGNVTFAGTSLVLGGQYQVVVLPSTSDGVDYELAVGSTYQIGVNSPEMVQVALTGAQPNSAIEGLYIVSASNSDPTDVTASGVLSLTFNRAIEIVDEDSFTASLTNATTAVLDATDASSAVTASVSTDGLVLTLTPNFSTAVVPYSTATGSSGDGTADISLGITYSGGAIKLAGDDESSSVNPLTLLELDGGVTNATVQITGPQDDSI